MAVYTTVYPGVEKYLADWYRSLRCQTDDDYDLWIGIDAVTPENAISAMGATPEATWVPASPGDSHAQVRQRALAQIVDSYAAVVLVDSDDILRPSRVAAARAALRTADVSGCALQLVGERAEDLGEQFTLPPGMSPDEVLPRHNIFGLSNTAYRCEALRQCLPLPPAAALVDWFLISRAWLRGSSLAFDRRVHMSYRQHATNTAQVRPPFSARRVIADTDRVRRHVELIQVAASDADLAERRALVDQMADDVARFQTRVVQQPTMLQRYVHDLNALHLDPLWWSSVAHPALRDLWADAEEPG